VKRGNVIFVGGIAAVLAAVGLSYLFLISGRELKPLPAAPPAPVVQMAARLASAAGDVQVSTGGEDWTRAAVGAALSAGTYLRTGDDARAEVTYGDDLRVRLTAGTHLRVGELRPDVARLVVGDGLVFADVRGGRGPRLEVRNSQGDAVATARDGALFVSAEPGGALRAAVTRGSADLTANGESVEVGPGFYSVAVPGNKPTAPASVPKSLLLKVQWPVETLTAKRRQLVTGSTSPGARVRVGNATLWADRKGHFRTVVSLKEGKNVIEVRSVDMVGREARDASSVIELDTHAPAQRVETSPDMWRR
jgi:hypothetical protein